MKQTLPKPRRELRKSDLGPGLSKRIAACNVLDCTLGSRSVGNTSYDCQSAAPGMASLSRGRDILNRPDRRFVTTGAVGKRTCRMPPRLLAVLAGRDDVLAVTVAGGLAGD